MQLFYPNNGIYKYKKMFNHLVAPRKAIVIQSSNINESMRVYLFYFLQPLTQKMNHFVPLTNHKSNKGNKKEGNHTR